MNTNSTRHTLLAGVLVIGVLASSSLAGSHSRRRSSGHSRGHNSWSIAGTVSINGNSNNLGLAFSHRGIGVSVGVGWPAQYAHVSYDQEPYRQRRYVSQQGWHVRQEPARVIRTRRHEPARVVRTRRGEPARVVRTRRGEPVRVVRTRRRYEPVYVTPVRYPEYTVTRTVRRYYRPDATWHVRTPRHRTIVREIVPTPRHRFEIEWARAIPRGCYEPRQTRRTTRIVRNRPTSLDILDAQIVAAWGN